MLVFLEDGACLKITEQEALDFGLRTGDDLDGRRLEQLKKAASVSNVKATAADLIGKRAMSRRDLERKLQEIFFPINGQFLFPFSISVPTPVGVRQPPRPAPPQRMRSAKVPCGTNSTFNSPANI